MNASIRPPAVASMFYPGDSDALKNEVNQYINDGKGMPELRAKAIIAPHAGYVYSGGVAGSAYQTIQSLASEIRRVVLLGPAHRVALQGIAAPSNDFFATPLGNVAIDQAAIAQLVNKFNFVQIIDEAHRQEHALEVQLPFLQELLDNFTVVPLVVGQTPPEDVAAVLNDLWGGDETLIVISSDLSHYQPYENAQQMDLATAACIEEFDYQNLPHEGACGYFPVCGLLKVARERNLAMHRLDMCNSGDTAGDKKSVVGYGAWALVGE